MSETDIMSRLRAGSIDPDLQAGSRGLSMREVVEFYFDSPGEVIALLREVRGKTEADLAAALGVSEATIRAFETGKQSPLPNHLVALSKALQADLRGLMAAFGSIRKDASEQSMGIAAQFAGEMTDDQKNDLKKLVEEFAAGRKGTP